MEKANNKINLSIRDDFYLLRKDLIKLLKKIFNSFFRKNNTSEELVIKESKSIKRFVEGETELFQKKIFYTDYLSYESTKNEVIDQQIYKFESNNLKPKIIDCGANIGLSIIFFKRLFEDAKIIAFEPDPVIFDTLKKNIQSFDLDNVELINKALWKNEGEISFFSEGADGGRIDDKIYGEGKLISLKTTQLSNYIDGPIDFLKIDIEGAETEVIKECQHKLHLVENIFIEYHSMVDSQQTLAEILDILKRNGFRYYISQIGIRSEHPFINKRVLLGMDNQLNIFGTRL